MRLIDADKLLDQLTDWRGDKEDVDRNDPHDIGYYAAMGRAIRFTSLSHTIDAVPVVRCKDCKHRFTRICPMFFEEHTYSDDEGYYWVDHDRTSDNGFCDEGERRDGEA